MIDGVGCADAIPDEWQEDFRQSAAPELTLTTPVSEPTEGPNPAVDLDVVDVVEEIDLFVSVCQKNPHLLDLEVVVNGNVNGTTPESSDR